MMNKIIIAAMLVALASVPAYAQDQLPPPASDQAGNGEDDSQAALAVDPYDAAADCLVHQAGLIQGQTPADVRKGNAHFVIWSEKKSTKIGVTLRHIGFYSGLMQGSLKSVDVNKVKDCMQKFFPDN